MELDARKAGIAITLAASIALPAESIRYAFYVDPVGVDTVCAGHTGDVDRKKIYTHAECMSLLSKDMASAVQAVDRCQPGLPIGVMAAFGDAVYNMGPTIVCDTTHSTAARKLKAKDYIGACKELPKWNKASVAGVMVALPGLTKRRAREMELCLKDAESKGI